MLECRRYHSKRYLHSVKIRPIGLYQEEEWILCRSCLNKIEMFVNHEAKLIKKKKDPSIPLDNW